MEKIRALLNEIVASDLAGSGICAVLALVLEDRKFHVHDYHGKLRESLPPWLVAHDFLKRTGKSTAIKYEPTPKLAELRALLAGPAPEAAAKSEVRGQKSEEQQPPANNLLAPSVQPPLPELLSAVPKTQTPKPSTPLFPWAAGAAAKFMQRKGEQQAATIKKWRALGYEPDMADLLIDACYKLQQGQEIPYSATLAEAARNAEMLAAKMFGG